MCIVWVTKNYSRTLKIWFHRLCSGIFDVVKITEIIEVGQYVSSRSIVHELKIDQKTVSNHVRNAGFKNKLNVWVPHQLTEEKMVDRISTCKVFITHFLNVGWLVMRNVLQCTKTIMVKALRSSSNDGSVARKVLLSIWKDWKGINYYLLLS